MKNRPVVCAVLSLFVAPVSTALFAARLAPPRIRARLQPRAPPRCLSPRACDGDGNLTKLAAELGEVGEGEAPFGALPPVGTTLVPLEPRSVDLVEEEMVSLLEGADSDSRYAKAQASSFVELFRSVTPYIKMHQGKPVVIHVSSSLLDQPKLFDDVMNDIATLCILGVRLVIVVGISDQVDAALLDAGHEPRREPQHVPIMPIGAAASERTAPIL